jgi:hypothetical protein
VQKGKAYVRFEVPMVVECDAVQAGRSVRTCLLCLKGCEDEGSRFLQKGYTFKHSLLQQNTYEISIPRS